MSSLIKFEDLGTMAGDKNISYLVPECHAESTVVVSYYNGMIKLECPKCGKVVVVMRVG